MPVCPQPSGNAKLQVCHNHQLHLTLVLTCALQILKSEVAAYRAAVFFCITPAGIFMSAVYTER